MLTEKSRCQIKRPHAVKININLDYDLNNKTPIDKMTRQSYNVTDKSFYFYW